MRRLPLVPLGAIGDLQTSFLELLALLSRSTGEQSYTQLWADSAKFRRVIGEVLSLNGMGGWDLTLGEKIALCVGQPGTPPLLAQYNLITDSMAAMPLSEKTLPTEDAPPPPKPQAKKLGDVFPIWGTDGGLIYPRGVLAAHHGEFEATYAALAAEVAELQSEWVFAASGAILLHSDEVRDLALHMIRLFGIDSGVLNIHQVCELALVCEAEPGLLPQLAGLVEFADQEKPEGEAIPPTHSSLHFLMGALAQAGIPWRSLMETLTLQEIESFGDGLNWAAGGGKSSPQQRKKERDAVFDKWFGGNSESKIPPFVEQYRKGKRTGIGL
jgi:hypothetical protein